MTAPPEPAGSPEKTPLQKAIDALKLRGIGPAVMGGRIADIAVHPTRPATWYVAAGSGGVWKTTNAGTTWQPIFDDQPSYSIGAVTLDPTNPETVWVGTGESVSGRHVAWGSGVYRSRDGGRSWQNTGLATSEHIGRILVDPRDGRVVYAAAEGPLWSDGGERGVFKTTDGGETWEAVLTIDAHTGATDLAFDPSNPDTLYAAAYQRRRRIWSFLGGGPGSAIYKSTDAGRTWRRLKTGLPEGDMGKIGLAVTPADPAVVYATIEAGEKEKGFYRSHDRGESWEKRSDYISNGTGPHYYQEIFASPTDPDLIYQVDVFLHVSRDAGKTFQKLETGRDKHSDNHVVWIDPSNGDHLLVGTDAGLYESFDQGESWRHFPNLPLSQFYRVALDSSEPFYYVLGGAQDLGTLLGPSRTLHVEGVRNQDWTVPIGADGHHVAFDPEEPAIAYMEFQNGNLFRYDRRSEEPLDIKPQPAPGDPPERWNWDSPLLVSPHHPARLYFASQRLWRSDDRGDTWTPVSGDLTRGQNRYELPMFGRVWSVDDLYDHRAMSQYATISTLSESPLVEGLLYAGTDDGLIQVSEDGGQSWREAGALPAVPELAFINAVAAGQAEGDVVFAVADAHKSGDTSPYVFESRDRGRTWRSIAGDLPIGTIVYGLAQDHVQPDLLFVGAEFGLYVSLNRGENWHRLSGAPTIAFRDLKLQRRDGDLVGASFGRGFYVLDDYTPLRELAAGALELELETEGHLFPVRDAWWYVPYVPMQARGMPTLGRSYFTAPNPPFGAVFTCFLAEKPQSARAARREREKALREEGGDIPFPGWEALQAEAVESEPQVLLLVRNEAGEPVRWVKGEAEAGLQRVAWDLRRPPVEPVELPPPESTSPWMTPPHGPLVAPGRYTVELVVVTAGELRQLGEPQSFVVRPLPAAPEGMDANELTAFQQAVGDLLRQVLGAAKEIGRSRERLDHLRAVLLQAPAADPALFRRIDDLTAALAALQTRLNGDESRRKLSEPATPSIQERVGRVKWGHWQTTQQPTTTQRRSFELAREDYGALRAELAALIEQDLPALEADLEAAGAPWTPGRRLV